MSIFALVCCCLFGIFVGSDCRARPTLVDVCLSEKECSTRQMTCEIDYKRDVNGCIKSCDQCVRSFVFESDIIVKDTSYRKLEYDYEETSSTRYVRSVTKQDEKEWPKVGEVIEVPYVFGQIDPITQRIVQLAIQEFQRKTCVRLVRRKAEKNFIEFKGVGKCSSHIGMVGKKQEIFLGQHCKNKGIVIHEIMHSLGFWHEQSRGDRDQFINIQLENVIYGQEFNFLKRAVHWDSYGSNYDLDSVMQYGGYYLSRGVGFLPTIISKRNNQPVRAQRIGLSIQDTLRINRKYRCLAYLPKYGKSRSKYISSTPKQTSSSLAHNCKDMISNCAVFTSKHYCRLSKDFKNKWCRKSCGTCTDTTIVISTVQTMQQTVACVDLHRDCKYFASKNFCTGRHESLMTNHCPKSCNLCGV